MPELTRMLFDSIQLIRENPVLFLPKLLISFLNSIPMILMPSLALASFDFSNTSINRGVLLEQLLLLLAFIFIVFFLDILFNSMYSFAAEDYLKNKKINLVHSLNSAFKKFFVVAPSIILSELISIAVIFLISIPLVFAVYSGNYLLVFVFSAASILAVLALFVVFYLVCPISSLETISSVNSVVESASKAKKNFSKISGISVIALLLSLLSIALPFFFNFPLLGIYSVALFVLLRLLIALISTYYYVLAPVFYLEGELI